MRRIARAFVVSIAVLVLGGAVLAIAIVTESNAWTWVMHTREVLQHVERLHFEVAMRDREAAQAQLRALASLTADNPRQQASISRIGQDALGPQAEAVVNDMRAEEERLLLQRTQQVGRARIATIAASIGLGLLALTLLFFLRSVGRRDAKRMAELGAQRQLALDAARLGWFHFDPRTGEVTHDARVAQIHGLTGLAASADAIFAGLHPADLPRVRAAVEAAIDPAQRKVYEEEYRVTLPDGGERWVLAHGIGIFEGEGREARATGLIGAAADITARKQSEAALRESEARTRLLADNMAQLAWIAGRDGAIHWYNKRWYDYTGETLQSMEGWGWRSVHHPEHVERVTEGFRRAIASGEPWEDLFPLRRHDGVYRWFLSRAIPIRGADGVITQWFGTNTDITAQRDAERALAELNRSLEMRVESRTHALRAANDEMEAFTYSVSHDLRAPLRGIHGYAEALREDFAAVLPNVGQEYLLRIAASAARMDDLIQDLLAYSRLSRDELELVPVSLEATTATALQALKSEIAERRATVEVVPPLPTVRASRAMLMQVVQNLVSNAMKFVEPGVTPHVRVWAEHRDAGRVRLWVADNGIGIAAKHQERIFRVFERLHGADVYPGTGIGLAIVCKGVERMGGQVGVESETGAGSRFWIELPTGG